MLLPLLSAVALFFLNSCQPLQPTVLRGKTMGTYWQVNIASQTVPALQKAIEDRLEAINQLMSTYRPDSELMQLNRNASAEAIPISDEMRTVLTAALKISAQSNGMYDVTVEPLVELWGFGPKKQETLPSDAEIAKALARVGYQRLTLTPSGLIKSRPDIAVDLSSIAKGYAVDQIAALLKKHQLNDYLVDIGGEIRANGSRFDKEWRIGVETPKSTQRDVQSVIKIKNRTLSLATSGNYRNFKDINGRHLVHTVNPKTGQTVSSHLLSVTVLAENTMLADGYATALMSLGAEKAPVFAEQHKLAVLFIFADPKNNGAFIMRQSTQYEQFLKETGNYD